MSNKTPILSYALSFLLVVYLLKLLDIADFSVMEILSYTFVFYGVSAVYTSMGRNKKLALFVGSAVFLVGIVFFLIENFDIINTTGIIFPATLLILGASSLMLYFDNTEDKAIMLIALVFILLGIVYSISVGSMRFSSFFSSLFHLTVKYWIIIVLSLVIIFVISRNKKE